MVPEPSLRLELLPLLVEQSDALVKHVHVLCLDHTAQLLLPRLQPLALVLRVVEGRGNVLVMRQMAKADE